ncbi:MAG: glycosyltransferase family 2 protein, partial [Promethearchaeota archaeon]
TPNMYQKIPEKKMTFKTQKASGCSMFMKKSTFLKLNGFDPYFFMYHEDTDFSLKALRNNIPIYTTNETILKHQKLTLILNDFTYYHIERNRYLYLYKNIENFKSLTPYLIISELMLLFQALLTKKLKQRFRIYKFLIQNLKQIYLLRTNKINNRSPKIKKNQLASNLDPILLGKFPSRIKILKALLEIINLILK